jgi:MFS family permease
VAVSCLAIGLVATLPLVREPTAHHAHGSLARPPRQLWLLGAVAFCAFLMDGAAANWVTVHLHGERGASEGAAAAGYLLFAAGLTLGRLGADRLTVRWSRARLVQVSGLAAGAGTAVAVLAPGLPLALAGWTVVGLAIAPLAPAVLGAAPGTGGSTAPVAIAAVTTIGYLGSFTGPPLIGAIANHSTLSLALGLVTIAGIAAALLAPHALRLHPVFDAAAPASRQ